MSVGWSAPGHVVRGPRLVGCLRVVAEPLKVEEATDALKDAVPEFSRYLENASIEIMSARDWYLQGGRSILKESQPVGATNSPRHPPEVTPA